MRSLESDEYTILKVLLIFLLFKILEYHCFVPSWIGNPLRVQPEYIAICSVE